MYKNFIHKKRMIKKRMKRFIVVAIVSILTILMVSQNYNAIASEDEVISEDSKVNLTGESYTVELGQMNGSVEEIIEMSKASAVNSSTNEEYPVIVVNDGGYKKEVGTYLVTLGVAEQPQLKLDIQVIVTDGMIPNDGVEYNLSAKDITLELAQASRLDDSIIILLAEAKATKTEKDGTSKEVDVVVKQKPDMSKVGLYQITFAVAENVEIEKSISMNVTENTVLHFPTIYIKDENIMISVGDEFDYMDGVLAFNSDGTDITSKVTFDKNVDVNKVGVYLVEYFVENDQGITDTKTRTVRVVSYEWESDIRISAESFSIIDAVMSGSEEEILEYSKAKAWDNKDGKSLEVIVKSNGGYSKTAGLYSIELSVKNHPEVSIQIIGTVKDTVVPTDGFTISGNDFEMVTNSVVNASDEELIALGSVRAYKQTGSKLIPVSVKVVDNQLQNKEGIYQVTYAVNEDLATKLTLTVKVIKEDIKDDEVILNASNYTIDKDTMSASEEEIIVNSNAKAWNASTGSQLKVIVKSKGDYKKKVGLYEIELGVEGVPNVTTKIMVSVTDGNIIPSTDYIIRAENFTITTAEANNISETKLIELGNVTAYKIVGGLDIQEVDAKVVNSIGKEVGIYNLTFAVAEAPETTITILVTVVNEVIVDEIMISANNFSIDLEKMDGSSAEIIEKSQAKAWNNANGKALKVKVVDDGGYEAKSGVYQIVLGVEGHPEVTTKIIAIVESNAVIEQKYRITADSFKIKTSEVSSLTDEKLIELANVKAVNLIDGSPVSQDMIQVLENNIDSKVGIYRVVFGIKGETQPTVSVEAVVDKGSVPTLSVTTPVTLEVGERFDVLKGISATDKEDGNITSQITYVGDVDTKHPGVYMVDYSVSDTDGNTVTARVVVIVTDGSYIVDEDFTLHAMDFQIELGNTRTRSMFLDNVISENIKAWDSKTGELAEVVVVNDGGFQNVEGMYQVTVGVKDKPTVQGNVQITVGNPVIKNEEEKIEDTEKENVSTQNDNETKQSPAPKTGVQNNIWMIVGVMGVSVLALIIFFVKSRKKN